jgi:putative sigma-54 modulation protein
MKITYTGRQVELAPAQLKKLQAQFSKIGKLLDGKREHEAHVVLSVERHLQKAEVTVNYLHHQLVGIGANGELFNAIHAAAEKLEKQVLKTRTKWRESHRSPRKETAAAGETAAPAAAERRTAARNRVHRVNHFENRKPMTLDEALLEIEKQPYLAYRDAETDRLRVLIRRNDGSFDLVEA